MINLFATQLSKRERFYFYCAAFVVIIALMQRVVVKPYYRYVDTLEKQIESKEIRLAKYRKLSLFKSRASHLLAKLPNSKMVGKAEEMTLFLKEIETMTRKSGLKVQDMKPLPVEDKGFCHQYSVELQADCFISALTAFLYTLQTSTANLKVRELQLTSYLNEQGESRLKVHFTIMKIHISS